MTTIAWDGKTICADTQATLTGDLKSLVGIRKIIKTKHGICAVTGTYNNRFNEFCEWVNNGATGGFFFTKDERTDFMWFTSGGVVYQFYKETRDTMDEPYMAWGSGWKLAMGALASGSTAKKAVQAACKLDIYSSEPVHSLPWTRKPKIFV